MNEILKLSGQSAFYRGKVRDVYFIEKDLLVIEASDRISAFDVILPETIPYKGQVLNQMAAFFLEKTSDIIPNWLIDCPLPNISIGHQCIPLKIEVVVRAYLTGHAWRMYKAGHRSLCGVSLPEDMKENEAFPQPIITPTTKANEGHDEDISEADLLKNNLASPEDWEYIRAKALELFERGTQMAAQRGLILVDTKYEFGKKGNTIYLIDEIHTPDSSRYFYRDEYEKRLRDNQPQNQLSKEFVRQWLIQNNFQGKEGQSIPEMTIEFVNMVSERYIELYEKMTDKKFEKQSKLSAAETSKIVSEKIKEIQNQLV
ncbi:MAG: phosphoribosylaminoimidazolesuccinocarboxamide synthase [Chitinophagaceae bacterium]|nr:MAG: phosphoribosylaminoimidazolesuccinocarboxamide synthase [Chitinophagaceae bacterium]